MTWRNFGAMPGYDQWKATDPADLEPDWDGTRDTTRAEEQIATDDAVAMVAIFQTELSHQPVWKVLRHLSQAMEEYATVGAAGWFLAVDQFAADFYARYGDVAILGALTTAVRNKEKRS